MESGDKAGKGVRELGKRVGDGEGHGEVDQGQAGLPDTSGGGTCGFRIVGDGRELWRSTKLDPGKPAAFSVDVSGVKELELRVDDGGDGNRTDWGMWFEPVLRR